MKLRRIGRVNGGCYEVVENCGSVIMQVPLSDARGDSKLLAAIKRNGWQEIPEA